MWKSWTGRRSTSRSAYRPSCAPDRPHTRRYVLGIPFRQAAKIGAYAVKQHLAGSKRYPLVLMLEPLFRCNLPGAGGGKIDYPDEILNQLLSHDECMGGIEECGPLAVPLAGGEPLL